MSSDPARSTFIRSVERATIAIGVLGAVAAAVAGCPGTLDDKLAFVINDAGGCGDIPTTLFAPTCAASGCHSADNPAGQLDLQSADVAARLVDKPATGLCKGTLADPLNPTKSILYLKLTSAPPCGSRMPLGATPLSDSELACVKSWIADQTVVSGGGGGAGGSSASASGGGGAKGTGGAGGGGGTTTGTSSGGGGGTSSGT